MLINQLYTPARELYIIIANLLGTFFRKVGKSRRETVVQEKELNSGFSTEVKRSRFFQVT